MMNAQKLRCARVAAEISASMLAAKARVNRTRLSHIENGYIQPNQEELERLNHALGQFVSTPNR